VSTVACVACQTPLPDGSRFCPTCGADSTNPGSGPRTSTGVTDLLAQLRTAVSDQYEITRMLGRGGMGAVFLAVDRKLDREVAIKVLPPDLAHDQQFVGRFEHEARTAAKLDHPGIIPIYAVEAEQDLHYFVMKYVRGRSLDSLIAAGPMPVDLVQKLLWESACALGHAHQRGVVHRDIKPANIMLDEQSRALLTDFGISKALQSASSFTATGQVIGTPHYMSPEQAKGEDVGGASDQYSLAVVGYRMLAGRLPFEDDSIHTVIYKQVFQDAPPLRGFRAEVPEFLAKALHRAMSKKPSDRFPTMEEFATAVWPENPVAPRAAGATLVRRASYTSTEAPTEISHPAVPTRVTSPRPQPKKKTGARWAVALALLVVLGGGGTSMLFLTPAGARLLERTGLRALNASRTQPPEMRAGDLGPVGTAAATGAPVESTTVAATAPDTAPPAAPVQQPVSRPPVQQPAPRTTPPVQPRPATPVTGFLSINSTPSGLVVVNGREYDNTPQRIELPVGQYLVEVRREGCETWRETLTITGGNPTRKAPSLKCEGP